MRGHRRRLPLPAFTGLAWRCKNDDAVIDIRVIPSGIDDDPSIINTGWYGARGWRGGRARNQDSYRPALTRLRVNIKAGWYESAATNAPHMEPHTFQKMTLQHNLKVAARVTSEVRLNVPNSANYAWTSSPVIGTQSLAPVPVMGQIGSAIMSAYTALTGAQSDPDPVGVHQGSNSALAAIRSGFGGRQPDSHSGYREDFRNIKAACYSARLGNCGELAAIACILLEKERRKGGSRSRSSTCRSGTWSRRIPRCRI